MFHKFAQPKDAEMNSLTDIKATHSSIAMALSAAQLLMGKALKTSSNPHFKSKYADLSSVVDACIPALNECGIAVIQPTIDEGEKLYVETVLIHGESGQELRCRVPLIVGKNDMQGYGSAVTYARRYGLMGMAGIAPEDDDGNAAAKAPPKAVQPVTPDQFVKLRDRIEDAGVDERKVLDSCGAQSLQQFPAASFNSAMIKLQKTIDQKAAPKDADLAGDKIPYMEAAE